MTAPFHPLIAGGIDPAEPARTLGPVRLAATLIVARDTPQGVEVLLLKRAERGDHNSGAWVFPGGTVDRSDAQWHRCCAGLDDAAASAQLGLPSGGLDFHVAAIRECFEESGLLFAVGPGAVDAAPLQPWRSPLHLGQRTLGEFCAETGLQLAADQLVYFSHWLTPLGHAKRFDVRFFIARAPAAQTASPDGSEMVDQQWLRAADALAQGEALKLMGPTRATLAALVVFDSVQAMLDAARQQAEVVMIAPRMASGAQGPRPVMPNEPSWAEIGRLDPLGHGRAGYAIEPDRPVHLSPNVIRLTAANAGVMTGPGTNSYLVGDPQRNEWAVIDPGPWLPEHVSALIAAAPGPIRWILVTHTHADHSPAAALLQARTGAVCCGRVAEQAERQDETFIPDRVLNGGERIALGPHATLRVVHTPGHASNHLCYLLEEERLLFTGDQVMQASTVVINPPDGDMSAYLASLRELMGLSLDWLAPGHGFLMDQPARVLQAIIDHRLKREAKVLAALRHCAPASLETLLPWVYDDVDPRLLPVAARSLLAHLLKLQADAVACQHDGQWHLS